MLKRNGTALLRATAPSRKLSKIEVPDPTAGTDKFQVTTERRICPAAIMFALQRLLRGERSTPEQIARRRQHDLNCPMGVSLSDDEILDRLSHVLADLLAAQT
jgi:hypothetical protein